MLAFKTRTFARWASKADLADDDLRKAATEIIAGTVDAGLGGGLIKKRIGRDGRGRRGGYRVIVAFTGGATLFFLFGFKKNERATIDERERLALKKLANLLLNLTGEKLQAAQESGELVEVRLHGERDEPDTR